MKAIRLRTAVAAGFAVGYYLGAKAGRERYAQLRKAINSLFSNPLAHQLRVRLHTSKEQPSEPHPVPPGTDRAAVSLDELPGELASRVMAATAHAADRQIERRTPAHGDDQFEVSAVAGDRVIHMVLSLRPDGSVAEATETFLRQDILRVAIASDHVSVEVDDTAGRRTIPLPMGLATALGATGG